jgi:hypothetical protein
MMVQEQNIAEKLVGGSPIPESEEKEEKVRIYVAVV